LNTAAKIGGQPELNYPFIDNEYEKTQKCALHRPFYSQKLVYSNIGQSNSSVNE